MTPVLDAVRREELLKLASELRHLAQKWGYQEGYQAGRLLVADQGADAIDALLAYIAELEAGRDELQAVFDITWEADQRAIKRWQAANPGNDLVWPDRADMVVWLLERDAEQRSRADDLEAALVPFAAFLPEAEAFVERAAATPGHSPIMPATKAFRVADFRRAAALLPKASVREERG